MIYNVQKGGEKMDNKNSKNNNICIVLLVLNVIMLSIMFYFIYQLNNKVDEIASISNSTSNTNSLGINTFDKKENSIDTDISKKEEKTVNVSSDKKEILSESEALKILDEKFKIAEKICVDTYSFFDVKSQEGRATKIVDFENRILKYGTENFLNEIKKYLSETVKFENNEYYIYMGGGARGYVGFDKFENVKISDTTITATLKTKQSTYNDSIGEWINIQDKESEFKLVKQGENWLIDEFNSSDLK